MQNISNILRNTALALVAAVFVTGCIFEKMDMPEDLQSVLIQVNVSADEIATKATPSATEATINSIRIYAFYNGKLSGHFYRGTASSEPVVMDLMLPESGTHNVNFYVVANEGSMTLTSASAQLSESTTESQLAQVMFGSFSSGNGLPMYYNGTVAINVDNVSEGFNTSAGHTDHNYITDGTSEAGIFEVKADLTRSVAKVSFFAATQTGSSAGISISDITMNASYTKAYGYLLPQSEADINAIPKGNSDVDYLASQMLISGTSGSYDDYMPVFSDYIFENPAGAQFSLAFTTGTGTVDIPEVKRNTHYKVYCYFNAEGTIEVSYVVADWEDTEEWVLEFDYPTYQSPVLPTGNHTASLPFGEATMYYTGTEEGAFSVDFRMTAPAGQTWTPTFMAEANDYRIAVYDTETGTEVTVPVTASDKWYTVKVIPMKPENVGQTVKLAFTYIPTWSVEPQFLLINGTSGNLAWTGAGSTADIIVIKQTDN